MVFLSRHLSCTTADAERYNGFAARQLDDFKNFINAHYATERRDTPFWKSVAQDFISDETKARLEMWQSKMPGNEDFNALPGGFAHTEQQLYYPVLDGLGLLNRDVARAHMEAHPQVRTKAKAAADSLTAEYRAAAPRAMGHREFLRSL